MSPCRPAPGTISRQAQRTACFDRWIRRFASRSRRREAAGKSPLRHRREAAAVGGTLAAGLSHEIRNPLGRIAAADPGEAPLGRLGSEQAAPAEPLELVQRRSVASIKSSPTSMQFARPATSPPVRVDLVTVVRFRAGLVAPTTRWSSRCCADRRSPAGRRRCQSAATGTAQRRPKRRRGHPGNVRIRLTEDGARALAHRRQRQRHPRSRSPRIFGAVLHNQRDRLRPRSPLVHSIIEQHRGAITIRRQPPAAPPSQSASPPLPPPTNPHLLRRFTVHAAE